MSAVAEKLAGQLKPLDALLAEIRQARRLAEDALAEAESREARRQTRERSGR